MNTYYYTIAKTRDDARLRLITSGWEELDTVDDRFHQHSIGLGYETERVATLGDGGLVELEVIEQ